MLIKHCICVKCPSDKAVFPKKTACLALMGYCEIGELWAPQQG